jgi:hypothetical protein
MEQSGQCQRVFRATLPGAVDFVNAAVYSAWLRVDSDGNLGDGRTNVTDATPVQTNGGFVASLPALLWAYGPHVWGSSVPDASLCLHRLNVNSAVFQLCEMSAKMRSPANLSRGAIPDDT